MNYIKADKESGNTIPNIALMLERNTLRFANRFIFREKHNDVFVGTTWKQFFEDIQNIAFNLKNIGFEKGDKIVVYSPNRLEMLQLELAVMASGGISVPIFAYFHKETAELLIKHSDAKFLAVASATQLSRISPDIPLKQIFIFDDVTNTHYKNLLPFNKLLNPRKDSQFSLSYDAAPDDVCLNMYTSGTMGIPKCVQLTHKNILSQQAALQSVWTLDENDRFLSYLPWHHSFGGIFERFSALYNGCTIALESGFGKDPEVILENWKIIQPTLFFSVPKVYQTLVEHTKADSKTEELFFHVQLKFIFTAAASLPKNISDEFEKRNVQVVEGWGLTETSPCCTLTDPSIKREQGVVGKPIPGVKIRIATDGEIQVKGPNVMVGYYKNDAANKTAFTDDGWYCTGDVGEITPSGLKLISRKDRIFKLLNGEKVIPTDMEFLIQNKCHYIQFAMVVGGGKEYPVALLFPNKKMLDNPHYELSPEEGCFCPRNLNELGRCLQGCLHDANCGIGEKFSKIKSAILIDDELSIEKNTLTPSLKAAPNNIMKAYKAHIENLYEVGKLPVDEEVYIIKLDTLNQTSIKSIT
ncbi:MAG: AMP-dependent synthetase/ligase [Bacteroidia bacterium]